MKTTDFYIFRHGETDWNRDHRFQGHSDIPLNATGRQQAEILRPLLEKYQPEVLLTSDLARARVTAEIANAGLHCDVHTTELLRECHLGEAEGMHRDDLAELHGEDFLERWLGIAPNSAPFNFPGGESNADHLGRITGYLEEFSRQQNHFQRIAVSTHGASLSRLVYHCVNAPARFVRFQNCSLHQLTYDHANGQWHYHGAL